MTRIFRAVALTAMAATTGFLSACFSTEVNEPRLVPIEQTEFNASLGVNLAASTKTANGVYYRDISVGSGAVVANGQAIRARYTGWLSNGVQFDTNVTTAGFGPFTLGTGNVIQGWHEGIQGMRVGGKRQLIIPASMGYGATGSGPIPGNAVIVFNIEIVSAT